MAKMRTKGQGKQQGRRIQRGGPEAGVMPVNTDESNSRGDQLSTALLFGLLILAVAVIVGGVYWGVTSFDTAFKMKDWLHCIVSSAVIVGSFFLARSIAWLSMFGTIALASRMGA